MPTGSTSQPTRTARTTAATTIATGRDDVAVSVDGTHANRSRVVARGAKTPVAGAVDLGRWRSHNPRRWPTITTTMALQMRLTPDTAMKKASCSTTAPYNTAVT